MPAPRFNRLIRTSASVLVLLASLVAMGCASGNRTPSYSTADDHALVGNWNIELLITYFDPDEPMKFVAEVDRTASPGQKPLPQSPLLMNIRAPQPRQDLYVLKLYHDTQAKNEAGTIYGQVLKSAKRQQYFSYRLKRSHDPSDPMTMSVPIQETLKIERQGEKIILFAPRTRLLWTPVPFAGDLELAHDDRRSEQGPFLVDSLDKVVAYYDKQPADTWTRVGVAVKSSSP